MRDPLKDLYKNAYKNEEILEDLGEWDAIKSKVRFQNFTSFKLTSFNIYYASAILMSVIINIASIVYLTSLHEKTKAETVVTIPESLKAPVDNDNRTHVESSDEELKSEITVNSVTTGKDENNVGNMSSKDQIKTVPGKISEVQSTNADDLASNYLADLQPDNSKDVTDSVKPFVLVHQVKVLKQDTIYVERTKKKRKTLAR